VRFHEYIKFAPILVIGVFSGVLSWDGSYEGGDIAAARRSYLGNSPIDIWGAVSGFFYGNLPDVVFSWGVWLTLLHLLCSTIGLFLIYNFILNHSKIVYTYFILLSYVLLIFSCKLTRDSTMTSLYILGLSLILFAKKLKRNNRLLVFALGTIAIVFAISFRPWLFFAAIIPVFFTNSIIRKKFIFALLLACLPFLLEKLTYLTTDFNRVNPELQVVTFDVAYMSCLSNDKGVRKDGTDILNFLSESNYSNNEICESFRLNTWQSVGKWSVSQQELGQTTYLNDVSNSKIAIATSISDEKYKKIRNKWVAYLLNNPRDYLQIKIIQLSQVLVVGDTFGFRAIEDLTKEIQISKLFFIPYDFMISFHILSPLLTILFSLILISVRYSSLNINVIFIEANLYIAYFFVICWAMLTTIAYIGDNGRYLYLSTFVFHSLLILSLPQLEKELKDAKAISAKDKI
jgi:hypothetical protein